MALEVENQHHQQQGQVNGGGAHSLVPSSSIAGLRRPIPVTLDLFHINLLPSSRINFKEPPPLPFGWQKFLNVKTGEIHYTKTRPKMSRRNGNAPKLDLQLNLSPPRANPLLNSPGRSVSVSPTSPPSSCVSSELNQNETLRYSSSPEATSMLLVGCPRCLMYVMLSEEDPKCPKCKSTVLLDFLHDDTATKKTRKSKE
ncbi:hypothetical protein L1049_009437 [Liquidambar formosana]|uniref:GIR1-like zinc ribbon domain-containing protein n=1 Tax=Liquidambar formosana TaxID=63359 RepID=A0AAP0X2X0_LIQFO